MKTSMRRGTLFVIAMFVLMIGMACSVGSFLPFLGDQGTPLPTLPPVEIKPGQGGIPTLPSLSTLPSIPTLAAGLPTLPAITAVSPSADVQSGLDKIDSYRMNFSMKVVGKDSDAKDAIQELKLLQEVIKSKESTHMSMNSTGVSTADMSGYIEIFQIAKTGYMLITDPGTKKTTCISFSSDKPAFDQNTLLTPDEMLGNYQKDTLIARGETVNGVKTDHYKLRQTDVGFGKIKNSTGEVWVAQDEGYVVRLTTQADGEFTLSTKVVIGTSTVTYDLLDVNKVSQITPPAECTATSTANQDFPIPANATEKGSMGEIQTFSSPDSPKVVADFYRKELPAQGWKILSDSPLGTVVMITTQKDTRKFSIMITPGKDDKGSSVVISKGQ